jgi:hypothetical protein
VQVTPAVENPAPAPENSSPLGLIALAVLAGLAGLGAMLLVTRQPGR